MRYGLGNSVTLVTVAMGALALAGCSTGEGALVEGFGSDGTGAATGGTGGMAPGGTGAMDGAGGGGVAPDGSGGALGADGGVPDVADGTGGAVDPGGDGDGDTDLPPCMNDPRQVIVMGDSYINWVSHTFPQDLVAAFGEGTAGVWDVPYGQGGRLYATGAWAMGSGGIGLIPDQLDFAIQDDPDIIAAVMTGGGNDFLVPGAEWVGGGDCKSSSMLPPAPVCQDIANTAFDAARELMHAAADAGVRDVVYFFYPEVPEPTLIGGASPNTILGWAYPQVQELCDDTESETDGRLRCHFLDTRPLFAGHPEWFAAGDIHENSAGSAAITGAITDMMRDRCIAQPADSGCCAP